MDRIAIWPAFVCFLSWGIVWIGFPAFLVGQPKQAYASRPIPLTDSIILQSRDSYCRGGSPVLTVTGTNVTWYADVGKQTKLAQGNTYHSPPLDQTTTFYLTQTLSGVETPPVAITIEMLEAFLRNYVPTPAHCGQNDGMLSVTATGGTARNPMYYSLNKGPAQRSGIFIDLAPGTYLLMDSIAAGCWGTINVVVPGPPTPTINALVPQEPHCGQADGSLTVSASGGAGSLAYSLNGIDFKLANTFTQLVGGDYRVWVRDQDGCTVSQPASLTKSVPLSLGPVVVEATRCGLSNGQINLPSSTGNGQLTYTLDSGQVNSSGIFTNLAAKTYSVRVRDEMGCHAVQSILVAASVGPVIQQIQTMTPLCGQSNGSLTISATSTSDLRYSLSGAGYQADSTFNHLSSGTYEVSVEDNQNCQAKQQVELGIPCQETIYLPDAFTPNKDGINEGWAIFFSTSGTYLDELIIFNRWGELIFRGVPHLLITGEVLWNGQFNDQIQSGSYAYRLRIRFPSGAHHLYQGNVAIIR